MSVDRVQSETPSTMFIRWIKYLAQKRKDNLTTHQKADYYLAQIAQTIHNSVSKSTVSMESKLIEFKLIKEKLQPKKPMTIEEVSRISKSFWCAATGRKR